MSKTLANIRDDLSIKIGDYIHSTVTTALAATNDLVDTELDNEDGGSTTNFWKNWWVLVTSEKNIGVVRKVSTYNATTWTIVTLGAAWTAETAGAKATYELHKHHPTRKKQAINIAARKSELWTDVLSYDLETGNILPNSNFDWWTSTALLTLWQTSNVTLLKNSTAPYVRSGTYSAKVTTTTAAGYIALRAREWPRLQDLAGQTVEFEAWALPQTANDPTITISYTDSAAAAQTEASTTESVAGVWTLIKMSFRIPADSTDITFRLGVDTNEQYVYYDSARVIVNGVRDYLLPEVFQDGTVDFIRRQAGGLGLYDCPSDEIGYDQSYLDLYGCNIISDGTYKYLRTPRLSDRYRLELRGSTPLNDALSAETDEMDIEADKTEYLVALAARELYKIERGLVSSESSDAYEKEIIRLDSEIAWLESKMGKLRTSQMRVRY